MHMHRGRTGRTSDIMMVIYVWNFVMLGDATKMLIWLMFVNAAKCIASFSVAPRPRLELGFKFKVRLCRNNGLGSR